MKVSIEIECDFAEKPAVFLVNAIRLLRETAGEISDDIGPLAAGFSFMNVKTNVPVDYSVTVGIAVK